MTRYEKLMISARTHSTLRLDCLERNLLDEANHHLEQQRSYLKQARDIKEN